jgi:hypothetical protein
LLSDSPVYPLDFAFEYASNPERKSSNFLNFGANVIGSVFSTLNFFFDLDTFLEIYCCGGELYIGDLCLFAYNDSILIKSVSSSDFSVLMNSQLLNN